MCQDVSTMKTETPVREPIRRPTIREVARLAGVSHQTVSRFLRFEGGLKPATMSRIEHAIAELGYRPNLIARSLATGRTGRLAVIIPPMAYSPAHMLAGASAAAHGAGYSLDIHSPEGGAEARTQLILDLVNSRQAEGILCFAPVLPAAEPSSGGPAVVIAAEFDDEMRGIGEITDASPVTELIEHLATLGHRRFYHVSGDLSFASARTRKQLFCETVERFGLESAGVFDGDWSGESGIEAVRALPEQNPPTAVIAANDLVAAGVIRGAFERGWSVPGDLSVTGWDNHCVGQFVVPSLTTVDVNLAQVGHNAMSRLVATLRQEDYLDPRVPINRLLWRESTAPAPLGKAS